MSMPGGVRGGDREESPYSIARRRPYANPAVLEQRRSLGRAVPARKAIGAMLDLTP